MLFCYLLDLHLCFQNIIVNVVQCSITLISSKNASWASNQGKQNNIRQNEHKDCHTLFTHNYCLCLISIFSVPQSVILIIIHVSNLLFCLFSHLLLGEDSFLWLMKIFCCRNSRYHVLMLKTTSARKVTGKLFLTAQTKMIIIHIMFVP